MGVPPPSGAEHTDMRRRVPWLVHLALDDQLVLCLSHQHLQASGKSGLKRSTAQRNVQHPVLRLRGTEVSDMLTVSYHGLQ